MKFYFDTSIWLDVVEKRGYNGEVAKKLFAKIILKDYMVLYSNLIIKELKNLGYFDTEINKILSIAKPNNLKQIHITKEQIMKAIKISKKRNIPLKDVIHALVAKDNEAQLITRDRHFQKLKNIITPKLPEELL